MMCYGRLVGWDEWWTGFCFQAFLFVVQWLFTDPVSELLACQIGRRWRILELSSSTTWAVFSSVAEVVCHSGAAGIVRRGMCCCGGEGLVGG